MNHRFHMLSRISQRYKRTLSRTICRRAWKMHNREPMISFTFDDFPRSSLYAGGQILQRNHIGGTYYVSLGLANQVTPTGETFLIEDLPLVTENGHELGCHTHDHCHAYQTSAARF